ncbi:MAG TPA: helix-turn-helix transcriptional regulator [Gaiella sp.]|jgi:DNA-binding NarL/FixJ family response regulator
MSGSRKLRGSAAPGRGPGALRVGLVVDGGPETSRVVGALTAEGIDVRRLSAPEVDGLRPGELDVLVVAGQDPAARNGSLAPLVDHLATTSVVLVWPSPRRAAVEAALEAGARGVVAAEEVERTVGPTVVAAAAGQVAVPADCVRPEARPLLSAREKQVLAMVVLGFSNLDIANRLFIAETTVKSHLSSVYRKLGVSSRQEATALILADGGLGLGILTLERAPA